MRVGIKMPLMQLPFSTIKLIASSQVITSVSSAVKELVENSIDAGATNITILLEKHGLEKIEVKDDGCGICRSDTPFMCLPNYTSKITDFNDLNNLNSYGFRGEALSSLCAVARVNVTTKTAEDDIAMCYTLDNNGQVKTAKVSQLLKGTIVTVTDIFKCLPVRKQLLSSSRRANEELKKVETVVKSLAVIHPRLRVTLIHNKFMIWQKTSVSNLRQSVSQIISHSIVKQLQYLNHTSELLKMEFLVPKRDCDVASVCISVASESRFLFINARPVRDKKIEKAIYNIILQYFGHYISVNKYPIFITSITLPQDTLDVNLEPNKTKVFIQNQEQVISCVIEELSLYYKKTQELEQSEDIDNVYKPVKRQKLGQPTAVSESSRIKYTENVSVNVIASQDNQMSDNPLENVNIAVIKQHEDSANTTTILNNIENHNFANDVLDVRNTNVEDAIISHETTTNDETKFDFSQNEIKHKSESAYFNTSDMDFSERNRSENFDGVEEAISVLNKNDTGLIFNTGTLISEETLELNSLLRISKPKSTNSIICEKTNEPLITEPQDCKIINTSMNKEKVNVLSNNTSQYDTENHVSLVDFVNEMPTYSQWSRGEVFDCDPVQIARKDVSETDSISNQILSTVSSPSVSTQMGQREMAAFTKFARNMRSKILEEKPGMTFTKVAADLATKWRNLQDEEKHTYEMEVEKEKKQKKLLSSKESKVQLPLNFLNKIQFKRPFLEMDVSLNHLKKMNEYITPKDIHADDRFGLINQVEASQLWVYYNGCDLKVISSLRLQEAVTFHKHLSEFKVPCKPSEEMLLLTSQDIEPALWKLLLDLEFHNNVITDSRITNNGFCVELIHDTEAKFIVTHIALNIKYYGIEDLCEILKLIEINGINCSLMKCRPLKVRNFIRNETFRECYSKEIISDLSSMKELLFYWIENVQPHSEVCLHDHPVALTIQ